MNQRHQQQTPNIERRAMPLSGKLKAGFIIGALAGCVTSNVERALSWCCRVRSPLKRSRLLAMSALLVFVAASAFAQPDPDFAKANDEFAKGRFQEAVRDYESIVQTKQWSAPLFYNLGNAYYRADDFGRAILNYERALALDPNQPEAAANLALAREETRALELQHGRLDAALKHVAATPFAIAAAIGFWLMVFALALRILNRRRSIIPLAIAVLGCLVAIASIALAYQIESSRKNLAVVTGSEIRARLATADNASSVLQLPPGSEVQILSRRGDWVYAALPNNLRGWLPNSSVEPIRL